MRSVALLLMLVVSPPLARVPSSLFVTGRSSPDPNFLRRFERNASDLSAPSQKSTPPSADDLRILLDASAKRDAHDAGAEPDIVRDRPRLEIRRVTLSGRIMIRMHNRSTRPLRLWDETNSWGAAHWRVIRFRHGVADVFYQDPDESFSRNIPTYSEIAPRASIEHALDLNDSNWLGHGPEPIRFAAGDTLIIIYDVPNQDLCLSEPFARARDAGVWHGVASVITTVKPTAPR
jgi:hypothetical protein